MGIIYKNGIPYGNQPSIDATLTHQGEAADAKAVGDEISDVRNTFDSLHIVTIQKRATDNIGTSWMDDIFNLPTPSIDRVLLFIHDMNNGDYGLLQKASNGKIRLANGFGVQSIPSGNGVCINGAYK